MCRLKRMLTRQRKRMLTRRMLTRQRHITPLSASHHRASGCHSKLWLPLQALANQPGARPAAPRLGSVRVRVRARVRVGHIAPRAAANPSPGHMANQSGEASCTVCLGVGLEQGGSGRAPSGQASPWEHRAAHSRQVRPEEAQEPSWGTLSRAGFPSASGSAASKVDP